MNIVEWRYEVAKNMDNEKRDDIRHLMNVIPGIIHSQFVQKEGYLTITLDTDLCNVDEIGALIRTKDENQQLKGISLLNEPVNQLIKRLFKL